MRSTALAESYVESGLGRPIGMRPSVELASFPEKSGTVDLLATALEALDFFPPFYLQSIFGPVRTWFATHRKDSEYSILDLWRAIRAMRYLVDFYVPSLAHEPPDLVRALLPPLWNSIFWRPTTFFEQPDPYDGSCSFPGERWFFINGMATNRAVAEMNSAVLSRLFHRPLTVIQNSTNSFFVDLAECAIGKEFKVSPDLEKRGSFTEPALRATLAVLAALDQEEIRKVVVLAHSQGTIITANVLRALIAFFETDQPEEAAESLTADAHEERELALRQDLATAFRNFGRPSPFEKLKKLEIYTFANCADKMKYVATDSQGERFPWMEHFANERDLVARLGVLAPSRGQEEQDAIVIEGPVYERKGRGYLKRGAWGHFLNEHYLFRIEDYLKGGKGKNPYPPQSSEIPDEPRLYRYFGG